MGRPGKGKWPRMSRRTKCAQASVRKEGSRPGVGECARVTGSMSVGYHPPFFHPSFPPSFLLSLPLFLTPPAFSLYFSSSPLSFFLPFLLPIFSSERWSFYKRRLLSNYWSSYLSFSRAEITSLEHEDQATSALWVKVSGYTLHQTWYGDNQLERHKANVLMTQDVLPSCGSDANP